MSNYGWTNEAGEPIMDGAAWRFEQQLDMDAQADYMADTFYDNEPSGDFIGECPECGGDLYDGDVDCFDCGALVTVSHDPVVIEDAGLDSYWEDRLTTLYE